MPTSPRPPAVNRWDQSVVGLGLPWAFWSDFHSIQLTPLSSVKTRGSMEPDRSDWQMNGWLAAVNGPVGEAEVASPMHCSSPQAK